MTANDIDSRSPRAGLSILGCVLFAGALFGAPFLREADAESFDGEDWRRAETDYPFLEDLGYTEEQLEIELAGPIAEGRERYFGLDSEWLIERDLLDHARLDPGRIVFELHCAGCHGTEGDGAGPAARHLDPRPRNFRLGIFKFTSTENGQKPLHRDLLRVVDEGLKGSAMPSFFLLSREKQRDVVEYVRYLSMQGEFERIALDIAWEDEEVPDMEMVANIVARGWEPEGQVTVYPSASEPERDEGSIALGRELFLGLDRTNCAACHGETGRGDGPTALDYTDEWGYPVVPRDLSAGVFRSGEDPLGLYLSIATGINGTPMGAFGGSLSGEEIWHLVHFVQSLAEPQEGND